MMTYLLGGPRHGEVIEVDGRPLVCLEERTAEAGLDYSSFSVGQLLAAMERRTASTYHPRQVSTSEGIYFYVYLHESVPDQLHLVPDVDFHRVFDRAYAMIQTEFHNRRAGRV